MDNIHTNLEIIYLLIIYLHVNVRDDVRCTDVAII